LKSATVFIEAGLTTEYEPLSARWQDWLLAHDFHPDWPTKKMIRFIVKIFINKGLQLN